MTKRLPTERDMYSIYHNKVKPRLEALSPEFKPFLPLLHTAEMSFFVQGTNRPGYIALRGENAMGGCMALVPDYCERWQDVIDSMADLLFSLPDMATAESFGGDTENFRCFHMTRDTVTELKVEIVAPTELAYWRKDTIRGQVKTVFRQHTELPQLLDLAEAFGKAAVGITLPVKKD
jgi:hypothetical protein